MAEGTRGRTLLAQRGALVDAEAVLLVDDDHPQRRELDRLGDEGVRPDQDVDRSGGELVDEPGARRGGRPAREQFDRHRTGPAEAPAVGNVEPGEQRPGGEVVLLGEDLGRDHEGALEAALDRVEQRRQGDDRLARPDVALQQPVHRLRRGEVVPDLADHAGLRRRELERERGEEALDEADPAPGRLDVVGDAAGVRGRGALAHDEGDLDPEQLVESEPAPGENGLFHRLGLVDGTERRGAAHQPGRGPPGLVERVGELARPLERLRHVPGELDRGDPRPPGLGVDRHDPAGLAGLGRPDDLDDRVRHLEGRPVAVDPAEQRHLTALGQLLRAPGLVEKRHPQLAGAVVDLGLDDAAPAPQAPERHLPHRRRDDPDVAGHELGDRDGVRPVGVAPWVVGEQVEDRGDPHRLERRPLAVPDPPQLGDGEPLELSELAAGRRRAHSIDTRYG